MAEQQPLVEQRQTACEAVAKSEEAEEPPESCAVDGKTVRRSGDAAAVFPAHTSSRPAGGLVIGQAAVPDKGSESGLHARLQHDFTYLSVDTEAVAVANLMHSH